MSAGAINGVIYVVGGNHIDRNSFESRVLARVDAYAVATDRWSRVASLPGPREGPNGASVIGGKLYVTGGRSNARTPQGFLKPTRTLFVYDPATNGWTRKADMPQAGCGGVQGVIGGKLYVFMPSVRWCDPAGNGGTAARFYRYEPATDRWLSRAVPPSSAAWPEARSGTGGAINGKFYLVGPNAQLHVYDPAGNSWQAKAAMPELRNVMEAAVLNGKLFLIGGVPLSSEFPQPTVEVYNPETNTWSRKAPIPVGTVDGAAVGAAGKVYYVSGWIGTSLASRMFAYTP
jgi:N-acetylneuraminic acid mutarotase